MEKTKDSVTQLILEKLAPYKERLSNLESSLTSKDDEIRILKLAVERLKTLKTKLEKPAKPTKPGTGKRSRK